MKSISLILILLIPLFIFSQDEEKCKGLKYGSFELYENGKKIGDVFRKENLQIEKYFDKDNYSFVKIKPNNCEFYFNAYEIIKDLDTITWLVSYKKIKKNHYSFTGKPVYLNIDYVYQGELIKIANEISEEVEEIFYKME